MYKHLSSLMHELWPALDPHTITLPWAMFTCSVTLVQTHWYLPTVLCSESEQSDIHDHPFEKSKLGFQLSQVWYPKAGCPVWLSLLCFDEVKSHTVTTDEYLFWVTLSLRPSFDGPILFFFLPATFVNLHRFPATQNLRMTSGLLLLEIFKHVCAMTRDSCAVHGFCVVRNFS